MTTFLAPHTPVHAFGGCRSYQRPGLAIGSKIDAEALQRSRQSRTTKRPMQTSSSAPVGITAADYRQGAIETSWHPLPDTDDSPQETRVVMMFATGCQRTSHNNVDPATPFIFVPCQLDISSCEQFSGQSGSSSSCVEKLECVGLPGDFVRAFLSGVLLPGGGMSDSDQLGAAHFDDDDPWVFSRCIMTDFSGMGSEEAAFLSREGRLGCWASVTLTRQASGTWDLGFLIHRLVVSAGH
ncbi:hypothetical protein V8F20_005397 [Naviculisporaceae sp. PSN 640]